MQVVSQTHLYQQTKGFSTLPCDRLEPQNNVSICSIVHIPSHSLHILKIQNSIFKCHTERTEKQDTELLKSTIDDEQVNNSTV